jgi:hypothetical protein
MSATVALCSPEAGADPDDWFARPGTEAYVSAMQTCMDCPLYQGCAQYALDEGIPDGIFGGMGAAERERRWGPAGPPKNHLAGLYAEIDTLTRYRHAQGYVA